MTVKARDLLHFRVNVEVTDGNKDDELWKHTRLVQ